MFHLALCIRRSWASLGALQLRGGSSSLAWFVADFPISSLDLPSRPSPFAALDLARWFVDCSSDCIPSQVLSFDNNGNDMQ
ncbi:hypothetical protein V6N13_127048 [Hibiscus sabdariffa]